MSLVNRFQAVLTKQKAKASPNALHAPLNAVTACAALSLLLAALPANAQLIHRYAFDSGANDAVGGANGTLLSGASVSGGILSLDGTDDYVQLNQKIVPTSGDYSVTLFARQNVSQAGSFVEFISQGSSGGPGFYIGLSSSGRIRLTDSWTPIVANPSVGVWHHYALIVGGGTSRFYFDGVLADSLAAEITTTLSGSNTFFGKQFAPFGEFFNGSIDEVRVYDNALSGSEVATLASMNPAVVPEAGTLALLGAAFVPVTVAIVRRRRNVSGC